MKPVQFNSILLILAVLVLNCTALSRAGQEISEDWELHEIEVTPSGMLQGISGDPYIIFPEIEQPECSLSGIHFVLRFERMPHKPLYMELFWRPSHEMFGEVRKVFFILPPAKGKDSVSFIVPLTRQAGYKQIRLDFPGDLKTPFVVEKYEIVPADAFPPDAHVVETYAKLAGSEVNNPAVIIPYLLKTFRHGTVRLARDPAFLIFWLLLIGALLAAHRMVIRSCTHSSRE